MMKRCILCALCILMCVTHCAYFAAPAEQITLPSLFTDDMILQREIKVPVWGKATPAGKVTVEFQDQKKATVADENGAWMIRLDPMPAGGPFTLKIIGKETIQLSNVMVGEIWVCSGQSNMEWGVNNSNNAREEIAAADHPNIRLFHVNQATSLNEQEDVDAGAWKVCSSSSIPSFSAVAYFFGR
ncbi:sialate O-acetylesterase, partial [candidate division KSB1 bacterium]